MCSSKNSARYFITGGSRSGGSSPKIVISSVFYASRAQATSISQGCSNPRLLSSSARANAAFRFLSPAGRTSAARTACASSRLTLTSREKRPSTRSETAEVDHLGFGRPARLQVGSPSIKRAARVLPQRTLHRTETQYCRQGLSGMIRLSRGSHRRREMSANSDIFKMTPALKPRSVGIEPGFRRSLAAGQCAGPGSSTMICRSSSSPISALN
jgi:hypothetical protein